MIDPPQPLDRGVPPKLRDWLNRLRDFAAANKPLPGPACNVYRGTNGSLIDPIPAPSAAGGSTAAVLQPFQLVPAVNSSNEPRVRVVRGLINGEAPTGFSSGDNPPYLLSPADGHYIFLILTFSATTGVLTSRTLSSAATMPSDADESSSTTLKLHIEIGQVGKAGSTEPYTITNQAFTGNIDLRAYYVFINAELAVEFVSTWGRAPLAIPE